MESMTKDATNADAAAEMDALERSLAYQFAAGVIDGESIAVGDDKEWSEIDPEGEVDLFDAVRYLESRGLLERHPDHPNWVMVCDEACEAVA